MREPADPGKQFSDLAARYVRRVRNTYGHGVVAGWRQWKRWIRGEPIIDRKPPDSETYKLTHYRTPQIAELLD